MSLVIGNVYSNKEIHAEFGGGIQGGIRKGKNSNNIVLIANYVHSLYNDGWYNGLFHYTGSGTTGNQNINKWPNSEVLNCKAKGNHLQLFECFKEKKYRYKGEFILDSHTTSRQKDQNGTDRVVIIFILKPLDKQPPIPQEEINTLHKRQQKKVKKLSDEELAEYEKTQSKKASKTESSSISFLRSAVISEIAKRRAKGVCELCRNKAPFENMHGEPYLETHHIIWLSKGGDDTRTNTVALCPNCHRKMHVLKDPEDVKKLLAIPKDW